MKDLSFRVKNEHFFWLLTLVVPVVVVITLVRSMSVFFVAKSDFMNLYVGAEMVKQGLGKFLYEPIKNYEVQVRILTPYGFPHLNNTVFRPLPFVSLLLLPFTFIDLLNAFRFMIFINTLIIFLLGYLAFKTFKISLNRSWPFFLISFLFLAHLFSLEMGQTSVLLALILLLIYKSFLDRKNFLAGALTSFLLLKTQYIIFFPFLFLISTERGKFLKALVALVVVILLLSFGVAGKDSLLSYPSFLLATEGPDYGSRIEQMFTIYSMLARQSVLVEYAFFLNFCLYFFSLLLFVKRKSKIDFNNAFISLSLISVAFSIHVLAFDLSFLIVPIFIIIAKELKKERFRFSLDLFLATLLFLAPGMVLIHDVYFTPLVLLAIGYYYLYV